ncbi:hypothetical protein GCM10022415_15290 [Knoellia locipacati]|uniref:Uncharacterized protein n=1 Tax=Knoellia locipacati TaxID=882824 RepID=A0A512SZW9_9MICO|nr:hypothetical protein KLO01_15260 [Knoellia locipacati]
MQPLSVLVTRPVIVVGRARPLDGMLGLVPAGPDGCEVGDEDADEGMSEGPTSEPASPAPPQAVRSVRAQSALTAYEIVCRCGRVGMVMNLRRGPPANGSRAGPQRESAATRGTTAGSSPDISGLKPSLTTTSRLLGTT